MARVLIVDDDPDLRALARATLEASHFEVVDVADGAGMRAALLGAPFDALVLDLNLEGANGLELLRDLRAGETDGRLPVLFLSAHADSGDRIEGLRAGADDYLAKPFAPEELQLRVAALVARRGSGAPRPGPTLDEIEARLVGDRFEDDIRLGRYRLRARIGRGAIGVVYRAEDTLLHRAVALKTLRQGLPAESPGRSDDMVDHLLAEARTVALFQHPNIVAIYDVAEPSEPVPFIAMELVTGITLGALLTRVRRLSCGEAVTVARGIAAGLAAAHAKGIVHGDIKPENVLLGLDGGIKLTDFGLAPVASRSAGKNAGIFGTPGFVPPEVLTGRGWSPSSDLFSFGSVLYTALAGEPPFTGDTLPETIGRTVRCEVALEPLARLGLDGGLIDLVRRLLAAAPARRPTIAAVRDALDRLTDGPAVRWPPPALAGELPLDDLPTPARAHAEWIRTSSIRPD